MIVVLNGLRSIRAIQEVMYGENIDLYLKIKELGSFLKNSSNYNSEVMEIIYYNLINSTGVDNSKRLLEIPELTDKQLEEYSLLNNELFQKMFETKYQIIGNDGLIFDLIRKYPISQYREKGKNKQFEILKNLNKFLDDEEKQDLETVLKESILQSECQIDEQTEKNIKSISLYFEKQIIENNLEEIDEIIQENIPDIVPLQQNAVKRIIKEIIVEAHNNNGNLTLNDLIQVFQDTITDERYGQYIMINKQYIIDVISNIFGNKEILNKINQDALDILKEFKHRVNPGWVRNILNYPRDLNQKEFELISKSLGIELECQTISRIKSDVDIKEIYEFLIKKEVPQIISFEKLERMFYRMRPPYSEKFKKFFGKNIEEIMKNPDFYLQLPLIHKNFDKILEKNPNLVGKKLTVENIFRAFINLNLFYENIHVGNEKLAFWAYKYKYSEEDFLKVQELFEKAKIREKTSIPPVTTQTQNNYRGRVLNTDDPLVLFVGEITNCCQILNDAGESSWEHSAINKNGSVFVIEEVDNYGNPVKVIAQSWVWRNVDRLCFDNIEMVDDYVKENNLQETIIEIYEQAGYLILEKDEKYLLSLLEEKKITQDVFDTWILKDITVGLNYTELLEDILDKKPKAKIVKPLGDKLYSDAEKEQVIIAQISDEKRKEIIERQNNMQTKNNEKEPPSFYDGRSNID